ncbi:MAG: nuclear transport factor 2 family protein [Rhodothermales bacterium]|nr:nuclear transport factor 2 family protein [Rhodothermales bacterium]
MQFLGQILILILAGYGSINVNDPLTTRSTDITELVLDQVDAFNGRNVDRLVANISDDFKWYWISSDSLILELEGKPAFAKSMTAYFESYPSVTSTIDDLVVVENRAMFRESVTYTTANDSVARSEAAAIYQVDDSLISRVWYFID